MRKLLLVLLVGCAEPTDVQPDANDGLCTLTENTVCHGAWSIAQAYCGRIRNCFGEVSDTCIGDTMRSLCLENDCSAYYPSSSQMKLDDCVMQYLTATCDGPKPPLCKLY